MTMVDGGESHFFGTINHGAVEYERWDYRMNSVKAAVERIEALDILCTASTATPLLVGGLEHFCFFLYIGNHNPLKPPTSRTAWSQKFRTAL